MNVPRSELHALRSERRAYAQAILDIREATGLHHVPLDQLAGAIEDVISNLAVQNSILAEGQPEPGPTVDETAQAVAEAYDEWSPKDVVVPAPVTSCAGCLRLIEVDGRLSCNEPRSIPWHHATIIWPGPGCAWASDCDQVYGGRRG